MNIISEMLKECKQKTYTLQKGELEHIFINDVCLFFNEINVSNTHVDFLNDGTPVASLRIAFIETINGLKVK